MEKILFERIYIYIILIDFCNAINEMMDRILFHKHFENMNFPKLNFWGLYNGVYKMQTQFWNTISNGISKLGLQVLCSIFNAWKYNWNWNKKKSTVTIRPVLTHAKWLVSTPCTCLVACSYITSQKSIWWMTCVHHTAVISTSGYLTICMMNSTNFNTLNS